jgi:hypothetical protein
MRQAFQFRIVAVDPAGVLGAIGWKQLPSQSEDSDPKNRPMMINRRRRAGRRRRHRTSFHRANFACVLE